ncbi:uncharacterized protein UTRI_04044 [Ustilago trichophora]|uniref:Velvet domain-containing protein n=1 Tax=Ustilago trichophora TaxID=86804 RepID=A0A5C3E8R0_9BASI|nr:uncharacterized protein UTRI_04044 [Ustilago trichophora]
MDDDRYYDRGISRFSARDGQLNHVSSLPPLAHNSTSPYPVDRSYDRQYSSYTHQERSHHIDQPQQYRQKSPRSYDSQQQQQQQQHRSSQREAEWTPASASYRSSSSAHDAPGSSHQIKYRARPDASASAAPTSSSLPNRSEWLLLPSVSHALSMYGDNRRQEPRFSLVIRQQPRRGLAIGNSQMSLRTARSVPIDPPPVCELLIDRSGDEQLLSLPEVFIRAQLVRGDSPTDECLPDARRIEPLVGDTLQSPFNSRIDTREDQSFFVFKELGIRNRGFYRLRFDLFDRVGLRIFKIASVYSDAFEVQERRKHPGLSASSALMDALVDRGMKYKLRKANDKQNPKKRKSPEDFYYGDERSVTAARRQSYAAGEYERGVHFARSTFAEVPSQPQQQQQQQQQSQLVRPIPHRALSGERIALAHSNEDRREMLPPLSSSVGGAYTSSQGSPFRLSPPSSRTAEKPPQLPSLSRQPPPSRAPYSLPQLHLSSSHLPPHPALHSSRAEWGNVQQEEWEDHESSRYNNGATSAGASAGPRHLSPMTTTEGDRSRPALEFRSSSSSVATSNSNSTGRDALASGHNSTPSSSATEGTPFIFDAAKQDASDIRNNAGPSNSRMDGNGIGPERREPVIGTSADRQLALSSSSSTTPSSSTSIHRPTLPPISTLYTGPAATQPRRASMATNTDSYFPKQSTNSPPAQRHSPRH